MGRKCRSLCMGVVARYLRSVGAALHSPTWLPTALLRATFLTPQSFQKHLPALEFGSRTARTQLGGSFRSAGVKSFVKSCAFIRLFCQRESPQQPKQVSEDGGFRLVSASRAHVYGQGSRVWVRILSSFLRFRGVKTTKVIWKGPLN